MAFVCGLGEGIESAAFRCLGHNVLVILDARFDHQIIEAFRSFFLLLILMFLMVVDVMMMKLCHRNGIPMMGL